MSEQEELAIIAKKLEKYITMIHEPGSTWWNRNHTEVAEWYFIWNRKNIVNKVRYKKICNDLKTSNRDDIAKSIELSKNSSQYAKDFSYFFNNKSNNV